MTVAIRLAGLRKEFGAVTAVDGVDIEIRDGEFFSMLGPSGSGKTTVLRLIAGFERPTQGTVELGGVDVTDTPPYRRDVHTVFQDYALFPHMSVRENVEYALRVRRVARAERARRAEEALETVRLAGFGSRRPQQLSGGQRQRVALARALVNRPTVLLLDEPLGALDLKLRREMQIELKQIQREVGITFVFVTHDQEEALTLSDRIAVFNEGRIEQVDSPEEIYERPATPFVAGFVGTSNLLDPAVAEQILGEAHLVSVRPEKVRMRAESADVPAGEVSASGAISDVVYLGASTHTVVDLDLGGRLSVVQQNSESSLEQATARRGQRVVLSWSRDHVVTLRAQPRQGEPPEPAAAGAATTKER